MDWNGSAEGKFRREAIELAEIVAKQRDQKIDAKAIEQTIDCFEMRWKDDLGQAKDQELRGAGRLEAIRADEVAIRLRMDHDLRLGVLSMPNLSTDQLLDYLDATVKEGDNDAWQKIENEISDAAKARCAEQITNYYREFNQILESIVDDILEGKELKFEPKPAKDSRMETLRSAALEFLKSDKDQEIEKDF